MKMLKKNHFGEGLRYRTTRNSSHGIINIKNIFTDNECGNEDKNSFSASGEMTVAENLTTNITY